MADPVDTLAQALAEIQERKHDAGIAQAKCLTDGEFDLAAYYDGKRDAYALAESVFAAAARAVVEADRQDARTLLARALQAIDSDYEPTESEHYAFVADVRGWLADRQNQNRGDGTAVSSECTCRNLWGAPYRSHLGGTQVIDEDCLVHGAFAAGVRVPAVTPEQGLAAPLVARYRERVTAMDVLDTMEACLANNSPAARSKAQFRNTMESLLALARDAVRESEAAMKAEGFVAPPGVCPQCTKDLDSNGWCFECREQRAAAPLDTDPAARETEWCLRTDRESRPLPCCYEKGHDGPCYFRW